MLDKAIRLIKILTVIPEAPRKVSCREVARRLADMGLEVSVRTIQRDLVELSKHFQLVTDGNSPPGWSFMIGMTRVTIPES